MLTPPSDERRLIAASVAASVALHAAALALAPRYVHEPPLEPPQVLSVVLVDAPSAPPEAAPPEPPPPVRRLAPPRPAPRAVPMPPRREAPAPVATPAPVASAAPAPPESASKAERPAAAQAPAGPPAEAVAVAPREPVSPPDFRAAYLRNPPPGYPAAARRNGEEGTVTLRVLVSVAGEPREVALERSSGSDVLDAAALATVKTWRFVPARRGGEAQEAWVLVPIVFRLEPRG